MGTWIGLRAPIAGIAGPFAIGLWMVHSRPMTALAPLFAGLVALTWLAWRHPAARSALVPALALGLGVGRGALLYTPIAPTDLRLLTPPAPALATLGGVIASRPTTQVFDGEPSCAFELQARMIQRQRHPPSLASGRVQVRIKGLTAEKFSLGRRLRIRGVLAPPKAALYRGAPNPRTRLRHRGVYFALSAEGPQDLHWVTEAPRAPPWLQRARHHLRARLTRHAPEGPRRDLLVAITLGRVAPLERAIVEPFRHSGVAHLFAVSGLHVGVVIGALAAALRWLGVVDPWRTVATSAALWIFVGIIGAPDSAVRAGVMGAILLWSPILRRPASVYNSIGLAAWLLLLWRPGNLFDLGFQLSFLVVFTLVAADPPIREWARERLRADRWIPLEDVGRPSRILWSVARVSARSLALCTIVTCITTPLVAQAFHRISPAAPLANALLTPLAAPILIGAWGGLALDCVAPDVATYPVRAAWFLMGLLHQGAEYFADPQLGSRPCQGLGPGPTQLLYACLGLAGGLYRSHGRAGVALATIGVASALVWSAALRPQASLTALPMSGGGVTLFTQRSGTPRRFLIDCGTARGASTRVQPFLHAQGIGQIRDVVLTHGDIDQVGGAEWMIRQFQTQRFWVSSIPFRSPAYRRAQSLAQEGAVDWRAMDPQETLAHSHA